VGKNRSELGGIALAVDGVGHVFTASARAFDEEGNYVDCHLVKHAAVDGSILWSKGILNDEVGGGDFLAMALDGGGNVVLARPVIIPVPGHPSLVEYVTAKYAADDGGLLWENHFNGSENSGVLRAVAVDSGGHVVVTGELTLPRPGGGLQTDLWTVRYAAVGGALLWEQRTTTPVDSSILAHAITVDAGGNVAVVGTYNGDRSESGCRPATVCSQETHNSHSRSNFSRCRGFSTASTISASCAVASVSSPVKMISPFTPRAAGIPAMRWRSEARWSAAA